MNSITKKGYNKTLELLSTSTNPANTLQGLESQLQKEQGFREDESKRWSGNTGLSKVSRLA